MQNGSEQRKFREQTLGMFYMSAMMYCYAHVVSTLIR